MDYLFVYIYIYLLLLLLIWGGYDLNIRVHTQVVVFYVDFE